MFRLSLLLLLSGFVCSLCLLHSCRLEPDMKECRYNVMLEYSFMKNGELQAEETYRQAFQEFIFDEQGILVATSEAPDCYNTQTRYSLKRGKKYSVIAWSGIKRSTELSAWTIGETRLEEMLLRQNENSDYADVLLYGYANFTVPQLGTLYRRVELTQAYAMMTYTVRWVRDAPEKVDRPIMEMRDTPQGFSFLPGVETQDSRAGYGLLTLPTHAEGITGNHSILGSVEMEEKTKAIQVNGTMLIHRLTSADHPLYCLYDGEQPLMKEIDLHKFFSEMGVDLDTALKEEYEIIIEIDGDHIEVMFLDAGGWEDGGVISGSL